ncbi:FHA domain containing protein [Beutenbergia cavernae DSM 12333]|uniref:FHA domain containing protein n=1 Tax=Beutenbergia cavernae (strain ATCC BAA-8 / DSM 12333 / CCUG 43141 / JCM 11478 / NBRC 16432 / NCIMB 13614 / HKI 0122) TaxID=471853 RepID=C5C4P1_BEUC1|nr:FHA domain-containing protein [Beutenbergia cavernae]ACQ80019.1 FHA domain containing protein [Beutenbergia cavernae DSM 12333]
MSLTAAAVPAPAQPYVGEAFRGPWPNDGARLTYRREAIAALAPAYAAPSRFWLALAAWVCGAIGGTLLGTGVGAMATGTFGTVVGIVMLLVGLALGVLGAVLGVGVIRTGTVLSRALQGWLAIGREDRFLGLGQLLGGTGIARVVLGALLLLGGIGSVLQGVSALGGPQGVGTALPLLLGSVASWVTGVTVALGVIRIQRGFSGTTPAAVATAAAPGPGPDPDHGAWTGPATSPSADDIARWPTGAPIAKVAGAGEGATPSTAADAAAPGAPHGIVTAVPGFAPPAVPGAAPAPAPAPVPPAEPAVPVPPAEPPATRPDEVEDSTLLRQDVEATRLSSPAEPPQVRVSLSDGTALEAGRTLVGRSPGAREGEDVDAFVAVADRSVSKTHLLVEIADGVVTVTDRASTNGTVLETPGGTRPCAPWIPEVVPIGARVRFGALVLVVEDAARLASQ